MTKKVLIQCQTITYFYMGLAAAYTKYPDEDLEIDVLFIREKELLERFLPQLKKSKYIKNIYSIDIGKLFKINNKINKLKHNFIGELKYNLFLKNKMLSTIKNNLPLKDYSDIFYSEVWDLYTYLKMLFPNTLFNVYGDGAGMLRGQASNTINLYNKVKYFHKEFRPNEIISLMPYICENSFDSGDIPIRATEPEILKSILKNDTYIQETLNKYTDKLLADNSSYQTKVLLLASRLEEKRFFMSEDDQINIYVDMITKNCPKNSLIIIKLHPVTKSDFVPMLQERCADDYKIVAIPSELKDYSIELFEKLINSVDYTIPFMSSAMLTLSYLYNSKIIDIENVVQDYNVKYRVIPTIKFFRNILESLKTWDKKSVVFKYDVVGEIKQLVEENNINWHFEEDKKLKPLEKIFSIRNRYKNGKKKKILTILGVKISI